jgi:hypothetical protein
MFDEVLIDDLSRSFPLTLTDDSPIDDSQCVSVDLSFALWCWSIMDALHSMAPFSRITCVNLCTFSKSVCFSGSFSSHYVVGPFWMHYI